MINTAPIDFAGEPGIPTSGSAIDFSQGEFLNNAGSVIAQKNVVRFAVPSSLVQRKLYAYIFGKPDGSLTTFNFDCRIRLLASNGVSELGNLPLNINSFGANFPPLYASSRVAIIGSTNTASGPDFILVTPRAQLSGEPATMYLMPFNFTAAFDEIAVDIVQASGVGLARIFIAVSSCNA